MIRLIAAAVLFTAVPALAAERGFQVGDFHGLSLAGSPDVTVTTGHAPSVHATGSDVALDRLDIGVEGGTLKIGTKRGLDWSWKDHGRVTIVITVPMLREVAIAGSGDVTVDTVKVRDFAGTVAGSGSLHLPALDADHASFEVTGSGTIAATGRCGSGTAKITGSGDLKLAALKCATLSANVTGSGSIDAFATQTAAVATMGSGDINITGGARCTVSSAGSGKAKCS